MCCISYYAGACLSTFSSYVAPSATQRRMHPCTPCPWAFLNSRAWCSRMTTATRHVSVISHFTHHQPTRDDTSKTISETLVCAAAVTAPSRAISRFRPGDANTPARTCRTCQGSRCTHLHLRTWYEEEWSKARWMRETGRGERTMTGLWHKHAYTYSAGDNAGTHAGLSHSINVYCCYKQHGKCRRVHIAKSTLQSSRRQNSCKESPQVRHGAADSPRQP